MLLRAFLKSKAPYFSLCVIAVIAYLPVSTMTFALKNDIIALEYPIKFFISDALHNNAGPFWFNTWAMGFPLESIITWSAFSPPGFLFAALTRYNLYTLHIEFVFYIALAGCSIYYLLQKHFVADKRTGFFLSLCYMLSGFCVGSSQWLLYLTAASFIPLCLAMLLNLLAAPRWRTALLFAVSFYIMLTSVYVAFSIIAVYILFSVGVYGAYRKYKSNKVQFKNILKFTVLSLVLIMILSAPCLISSLRVLSYINRGNPIAGDQHFFQTNFLRPDGLLSLIGPLTVARINEGGTEGTMMNTYIGLFALLLLPVAIWKTFQIRDRRSIVLIATSVFFLFLSFGHLTPIRGLVNILPGFSYFRNAGLIRFFFILFLVLFLGNSFAHGLPQTNDKQAKTLVRITAILISSVLIFFLVRHIDVLQTIEINGTGVKQLIASIDKKSSLLFTSLIQLPLLWLLYFFWSQNRRRLLALLIAADLIFNTLVCLPFFTVSSYSVKQVSHILDTSPGYPVQSIPPSAVPASFTSGEAIWFNTNVYPKKVSLQPTYWGPLVLKSFNPETALILANGKPLVYGELANAVTITSQQPDLVKASISTGAPASIYFQQNWYPGWHAWLDQEELVIHPSQNKGMQVTVVKSGELVFKYKKTQLLITAYVINILILFIVLLLVTSKLLNNRRHLDSVSYQ